MEDIEEIKKLKARYCAACDGGWDGRASHDTEKIVALFAEEGVWEGGVYGRREGRDGIREFYQHNPEVPFAFHLLTNPIIEVDGDRATGNWHLMISMTQADRKSLLIAGVFEDEYVRLEDQTVPILAGLPHALPRRLDHAGCGKRDLNCALESGAGTTMPGKMQLGARQATCAGFRRLALFLY